MTTNDKDKNKPQSLASMAKELRELRNKVESRNAGTDEASVKQKERMDAIRKRISEDVRNDSNDGGRRMPSNAQKPNESKSSAQESVKMSPATKTMVESANNPSTEQPSSAKKVQKGISKNRFNKYAGQGRDHSYENYMTEDERKKKGESRIVGS